MVSFGSARSSSVHGYTLASVCASTTLRYAATMRCASCGVRGSTLRAQVRGVRASRVDDRKQLLRQLHLSRQLLMLLAERRQLCLAQQFFAKLPLVVGEPLIDVGSRHGPFLHVLDVSLQEVMNRLDPDPDRPARLVLVDVLERKVRCPGFLDDALDH